MSPSISCDPGPMLWPTHGFGRAADILPSCVLRDLSKAKNVKRPVAGQGLLLGKLSPTVLCIWVAALP